MVGLTLLACLSGVCLTRGSAFAVAPPSPEPHAQAATAEHGAHHQAVHAGAHHTATPAEAIAPLHDDCGDEACCRLTASTESRVEAPCAHGAVAVALVDGTVAPASGMLPRVQVRPPGNDPGAAPAPLTC